MSRTIKPATRDSSICLDNAIAAMRKARGWMRAANSPKALTKLQAAIKSAEGAQRHMRHRLQRSEPARLSPEDEAHLFATGHLPEDF